MRQPQSFRVVAHLRSKASRPQSNRARHRLLHVCVARQERRGFAAAELIERGGDAGGARVQFLDHVAQVQSQRREHLVVARSTQMNAARACADALRQALLKRRVPILIGKLDAPLSAGMFLRQSGEAARRAARSASSRSFAS